MPETGFIEIDSKDVVLSTWKPAEDGKGYVLRFYNTTDKPVVAHVGFPLLEFESVYQVNGLESYESPLAARQGQLELALKPHEIFSVRVVGFRLAAGRLAH
jgi:alpha-mannosidase